MATLITHAILTEKVFPLYFNQRNKKHFFVGTLFPDVRYLGVVNRERTHPGDITLNQILETQDDFKAGLQFHALIDGVWWKPFSDKHLAMPQGTKFAVDELLYNKIGEGKWKEIIRFLDTILPQELEFGVDRSVVQQWHNILQKYFSRRPNGRTRKKLLQGLKLSPAVTDQLEQSISQIKISQKLQAEVINLYNNIENLLENYDIAC